MKKFLTIIIFCFLTSQSFALDNVRKIFINKEIVNDYSAFLNIDHRNNSTGFYQQHYGLGIAKKIADDLTIRLRYRNIYSKFDNGFKLNERRPQFEIIKKNNYHNFTLLTRFRHDYRIFNNENLNRPRLRLKMIFDYEIFKLKPIISNEIYYTIDYKRFSNNRFEFGFLLPKFKKLSSEILFRNDSIYQIEIKEWQQDNFLTLKFSVNF